MLTKLLDFQHLAKCYLKVANGKASGSATAKKSLFGMEILTKLCKRLCR